MSVGAWTERPASAKLTSPLATSAIAPSSATPVRSSWRNGSPPSARGDRAECGGGSRGGRGCELPPPPVRPGPPEKPPPPPRRGGGGAVFPRGGGVGGRPPPPLVGRHPPGPRRTFRPGRAAS